MLNARGVEVCIGCEDKRAHGSACDTFLSLDKNIQLLKKLFFLGSKMIIIFCILVFCVSDRNLLYLINNRSLFQ